MSHEPPPSQIKAWKVENEKAKVPFQWLTWFFNLHTVVESNVSRIAQLESLIVNLTVSGYGGIRLLGSDVVGTDLGTGWDTLNYIYDSIGIAVPRGVTQDFANGTIAFTSDNIWQVNVVVSMSHDDVNRGRSMQLRVFNTITAVGSNPLDIAIGRNTPGTNVIVSFLIEVPTAELNDPFVLQVGNVLNASGNPDTMTTILYKTARLEATHQSELGALL